jgi:hypothetical protein
LVKLYHPDKHHHISIHGINHGTRLERYRLVVVANDILSDPQKRRAYDLFGMGWGGVPRDPGDIYRNADRKWRREPGNASGNATWEDWEQWYETKGGQPQRPVFMSNPAFAALVVFCVVAGGIGQATRAENHSTYIIDKRQEKHAHISEAIAKRGMASAGMSSSQRVEVFLRDRENTIYQFTPDRYDSQLESPK